MPALAFTAGGVTFIFCCSSLQNHVYHEKVKETTKGRKQDVSCKSVCVKLHSIVLQLERSSQSKNTVKLVYQIASLIFFFFFVKEKENTMEVGGNGHCVAEKTIPTSGRERITAQRQSEPDGKHSTVHVKLVGVPYE